MFSRGLGALKGTSFHTYLSALPLLHIFIILYVTKLLLSGNGINLALIYALIYLLISTEVSRTTGSLGRSAFDVFRRSIIHIWTLSKLPNTQMDIE